MRKNSVRHFIHAVIDVLPLLVIPIFALNILHKETEPISIEVQEKISVDFNQKYYKESDVLPYSITMCGNVTTIFGENYINVNGTMTANTDIVKGMASNKVNLLANHVYIFKCQLTQRLRLQQNYYASNGAQSGAGINYQNDTIKFTNHLQGNLTTYVIMDYTQDFNFDNIVLKPQLYDLTLMNMEDVTIEQFNTLFDNYPYEYIENEKMLVNKPTITTMNSTDIGSQFVYAMYKPVHDYFNFNNMFNMQGIYDWIQLNLFSGTAPLPVFIIWNIIVYEFFVDLLFLFYAVFMFVIDFAEKCLDRPFRR